MENKFNSTPNKSYVVDGKLIWESRSPAIVGVIIASFDAEDYVLIGKRGPGAADNQGLYNLPCGYLDYDENGHDGICREVWEETGLYLPNLHEVDGVHIFKPYMDQPFFVNTDPKENRQNVSLSYGLCFSCNKLPALSIENCEPDEVSDVRWVKLKDLKLYNFAFNHDERIQYFIDIVS
jgi:8-oxo-dGTP pyrophosphatase MutT (NUDIX family)